MLVSALLLAGRIDLAEIVRDKEKDFRLEQSLSARGLWLSFCFVF